MNISALPEYLALGYVAAPLSLFEGIEKVLPGHMLVCEPGKIRDQEYWDERFDRTEKRSEGDWIEQIRDKFLGACPRIHLCTAEFT